MAHKELKYDAEARRALEDGVNAVADAVTVVRFSQISDRPSEVQERLRPAGPRQN